MSPLVSPTVIEVRIWGQRVGAVSLDPARGCYAFEYAPRWVAGGVELAPLMMPLGDAVQPFVFPDLSRDTYRGLPGLLADALPDAFGNALVDAWMAQHGIDPAAVTTLDRLAYMGRRGLGALEFRPARGAQRETASAIEMKQLVEAARRAVRGDLADDRETKAALANIIRVGTSAGGARAKAVIAWNPKTDEVRSGQFDAAPDFEHWLVKFDGVDPAAREGAALANSADFGRIEYAYYLMATEAGIQMAPCRLLEENGRAHFMTKRFDRDGDRKNHVLTLCGMAHLDFRQRETHGYEQLFTSISRLGLGDDALDQAFRRMVFNVFAQNCDDHPKNVAFLRKQDGAWELAPAYDMTHAHNSRGEWTYQHLLSVAGKFRDITEADLLQVADRFQVPRAASVLREVRGAVERWDDFATEADIRGSERGRVSTDLRKVVG